MLNKSSKNEHLFFIPYLTGCFQLFTIGYVSYGFVIYALYYVEVVSLYDHFLENFYHKWCLILSEGFSVSVGMIIWLLFFNLLPQFITYDWFVDIKKSLHPWGKSHLIKVYDPFNVLMDFFFFLLVFCWRLFFYVHQWCWSLIFFFVVSLSGFGIRVMVAL